MKKSTRAATGQTVRWISIGAKTILPCLIDGATEDVEHFYRCPDIGKSILRAPVVGGHFYGSFNIFSGIGVYARPHPGPLPRGEGEHGHVAGYFLDPCCRHRFRVIYK